MPLPTDNPLYEIFSKGFVVKSITNYIYFDNYKVAAQIRKLIIDALPEKLSKGFCCCEVLPIPANNNKFYRIMLTNEIFETLLQLINKNKKNIKIYSNIKEYLDAQEKKRNIGMMQDYRFFEYAKNLRKVPDSDLFKKFSKEKFSKFDLTELEHNKIEGRKIWTDIVSATFQKNLENSNNVREKALQRVGNEDIYQKCIDFLTYHSVLTYTFDAQKLEDAKDFQLLNIWDGPYGFWQEFSYRDLRKKTERALFNYLPPELFKNLENNKYASPRYGVLRLIDHEQSIKESSTYGDSFIVFKPIVKFNSLFNAEDCLNYYAAKNCQKSLQPCTIHNLENILAQCADNTLDNIVHRIKNGYFDSSYQQNGLSKNEDYSGYIEALLPSVNLLDKNQIEHIHFDIHEHQLTKNEIQLFQNLGISFSNSNTSPYPQKSLELLEAIQKDDLSTVSTMLQNYPSLLTIVDVNGLNLLDKAIESHSDHIINFLSNKCFLKQENVANSCTIF